MLELPRGQRLKGEHGVGALLSTQPPPCPSPTVVHLGRRQGSSWLPGSWSFQGASLTISQLRLLSRGPCAHTTGTACSQPPSLGHAWAAPMQGGSFPLELTPLLQ